MFPKKQNSGVWNRLDFDFKYLFYPVPVVPDRHKYIETISKEMKFLEFKVN